MKDFSNNTADRITWESLREELLQLPQETLVDLIDVWVKNYWTNQNYWMVLVERDYGLENADRLDFEVWTNSIRAQVYRLKKVLHLGEDVQALATVLKLAATQWVNAGFAWQFNSITDTSCIIRINQCPMGVYRGENGLPLLPCKLASPSLYEIMAKIINPRFVVTCKHAHPDPAIEGVMCEWEFVLMPEGGE